jgi:NADH-quinone oxidoreductase subunit G
MMKLEGFDYESAQDVLKAVFGAEAPAFLPVGRLSNDCDAPTTALYPGEDPCVARIYKLDSLVRRATSLQLTVDARVAAGEGALA